jgi:hypothetical protein
VLPCTFVSSALSLSLSLFSGRERRGEKRQTTRRSRASRSHSPRRGERRKKGSPFERVSQNLSQKDRSAREREREITPPPPSRCSSRTKKNLLAGKEREKFLNTNISSTHLFSFLFALRADFLRRRANGRVSLDGLDSSSRGNFRANEGSSQHD